MMRPSSFGFVLGGMAAIVGAIILRNADLLAASWPSQGERGYGVIGLGLLASGLLVAVLGLLCWLWEDPF